ncbi:Phosphotransferase enzyme family protein [Actinokineospora alba]|uniref:Phosphotransferase enzyme family protein n=2 Tax=Actinokineospora alba TaxID=504798 RepID=A0A1H0L9S4_9PSEU|nr:phosphotransferase family enzyme [Actinokineospora alba]SDJ02864.1 Phosphotransferase enzyme family protein [Actinokineospora alba]SDO64994.1 Phosphotransferase enzyme family protein [Actinokineospora alba]
MDPVLCGDPRKVLEAAGRKAGVPTAEATLIRDGANVLYQLNDEVVARVGPSGSERVAARQVRASHWLFQAGIPVVRALAAIDQPTVVGDRPVTWWVRLPEHRHATPAELGEVLARLHALDVPESPSFPIVDPFGGILDSIEGGTALAEKDRVWLRDLAERLSNEYTALASLGLPKCVIHGDAWQGNVVVPTDGGAPVLLDLDHIGVGPREWDLVSLAVDYTDFDRISEPDYQAFVRTYGGYDMTTWPGYRTLATARELRWTAFVLGKANTGQKAAEEARHRVACLRGEINRPWSWSAF